MSDHTSLPCACRSAKLFDVSTPEGVLRSYNVAASMVNVKEKEPDQKCQHVDVDEFPQKDCRTCAVFFSSCFDDQNRCRRSNCGGNGDGSLLMFGLRHHFPSPNTKSVTNSIIVEATPWQNLRIDDGKEENGKSVFQAGTKVIYPWYSKLTEFNTWQARVPIRMERSKQPVGGNITIGLKVSDGIVSSKHAISLNVIVPPDGMEQTGDQGDCDAEAEGFVSETEKDALLATSLQFLLREGWGVFKRYGLNFGNDPTIALKIGSASFTEQSDPEAIAHAISEAATKINKGPTAVLKALNARMDYLLTIEGYFREKLGAGAVLDEVKIKGEIYLNDREIADTLKKIWKELAGTGQFRLVLRTSLNRPSTPDN